MERANMTALQAVIGLMLLLALLYGLFSRLHARQHGTALRQALLHCLDVLQRLQQHRGLGGQRTIEAHQQCLELSHALDALWSTPPPAAHELKELLPDWQALRREAGDFDGHCRLIDRLLTLIQLLELRSSEDLDIAHECRKIEQLGRLRGLAVRSANDMRCSMPAQIQLRYLIQRLHHHRLVNPALAKALERLSLELIEPMQVSITPSECYELLTPFIDQRINLLREHLMASSTSELAKDLLASPLLK